MKCALFYTPPEETGQNKFIGGLFPRAYKKKHLPRTCYMPLPPLQYAEPLVIDCRLPAVKKIPEQVSAAMEIARTNEAGIIGLSGWTAESHKESQQGRLSDGRRFLLAQLPLLLDADLGGWRLCDWVVSVDSVFSALLARYLAREVRSIYLTGEKKKPLAELIYRECGMTCRTGKLPPHLYAALTPAQKQTEETAPLPVWQNWSEEIVFDTEVNPCTVPVGWAEALLIADRRQREYQKWHRMDFWQQLEVLKQDLKNGWGK